jgi:hypothetical protein
MKGAYLVEQRCKRIAELKIMHSVHPKWSKEKLVAEFCIKYGTSWRVTFSYLNLLIKSGKITFT